MSCHKLLTSRNSFSLTFFILLFCLRISIVNSAGETWTCELLDVNVSQRWIGNNLIDTPESRAIQANLQKSIDLTTLGTDHWSCFETEAVSGILGTPGGDTSEFLLALSVLFQDSPLLNYTATTPSIPSTPSPSPSPSPSSLPSPSESPSSSPSFIPSDDSSSQLFNGSISPSASGSDVIPSDIPVSSENGTAWNVPSVIENVASVIANNTDLLSQVLPLYDSASPSPSPSQSPSESPSDVSSAWDSSSYPSANSVSATANDSGVYTLTSEYFNSTVIVNQTITVNGTIPPPAASNISSILNPPLFKRIHQIFDAFVRVNISSSRRFYYHSDYDIVERLRKRFGLRNRDVFYDMLTPEQQNEALSLVIKPENIGCRHILQILQNPTVYRTPAIITQTFLQVLHNYLWNHNNGTYFSKFYVDIPKRTHPVEIAHLNVSINVVAHPELENSYDHSETDANPCLRVQPTVPTLIGNESYFVVQHQGISLFRKKLADYVGSLPESKLNQQQTYAKIEELAGIQWALSQSKLGPNLKTFDVIVHAQNHTGEVIERTWLFVGIGVIAAALVAYLAYLYWKKRREAANGVRLFDEESPSEGLPIRVNNVSYSGNSGNPKST